MILPLLKIEASVRLRLKGKDSAFFHYSFGRKIKYQFNFFGECEKGISAGWFFSSLAMVRKLS